MNMVRSQNDSFREYLLDMLSELAALSHSCNEPRIGDILDAIVASETAPVSRAAAFRFNAISTEITTFDLCHSEIPTAP